MENDRRGYQEVCSDCEAYGLKKHGLTINLTVYHVHLCDIRDASHFD